MVISQAKKVNIGWSQLLKCEHFLLFSLLLISLNIFEFWTVRQYKTLKDLTTGPERF